jgi:hypothetical protein
LPRQLTTDRSCRPGDEHPATSERGPDLVIVDGDLRSSDEILDSHIAEAQFSTCYQLCDRWHCESTGIDIECPVGNLANRW